MISAASSVRSLLVYALVLPMALIMGYLLASPTDLGTWAMIAIVLLVLAAPVILARHHAVLFLTWNMTAVVFFLPGRPQVWLVMSGVSLFISLFQRALSREHRFISAPSLVIPLVFLAAVVLATAQLTGGLGLKILGSENVGGKRYFMLFAGMAGFLAMIAHRIPEEKALRYVGMFLLGSLTNAVTTILLFLGPGFYFLFLFFPVELETSFASVGLQPDIIRLWGSSVAAMGFFFYILARYGIRQSFSLKRPWRAILLFALLAFGSSGGFRTFLVLMTLTFAVLFYLEGLFVSKYALTFGACFIIFCALVIPLANKLPLSIQRTLSILPLQVSPVARFDAQISTEWRLEMWQIVLPEVPKHFWLGKGLGISRAELDLISEMSRRGRISSQEVAMLAGDYHNGPLSVIIPFGIWGAIGVVWFIGASLRALYRNYRYGPEEFQRINRLLLAVFVARLIVFIFVFGGFYADLAVFSGIVGLSLSLNNGIRKHVPAFVPRPVEPHEGFELAGAGVRAFVRSS